MFPSKNIKLKSINLEMCFLTRLNCGAVVSRPSDQRGPLGKESVHKASIIKNQKMQATRLVMRISCVFLPNLFSRVKPTQECLPMESSVHPNTAPLPNTEGEGTKGISEPAWCEYVLRCCLQLLPQPSGGRLSPWASLAKDATPRPPKSAFRSCKPSLTGWVFFLSLPPRGLGLKNPCPKARVRCLCDHFSLSVCFWPTEGQEC